MAQFSARAVKKKIRNWIPLGSALLIAQIGSHFDKAITQTSDREMVQNAM